MNPNDPGSPDPSPGAGGNSTGRASATPGVAPGALTSDERTWGMLAHLAAFAGLIFPLGNVVAPLIIWLVKREESAFVATQAKEALNFNISVVIGGVICGLLVLVFVGILLLIALGIAWLTLTIVAAIKASEGVAYRYPVSLRLVT